LRLQRPEWGFAINVENGPRCRGKLCAIDLAHEVLES
jgi:hypothetical protein